MIGRLIGNYRVVSMLGRGGMGVVYLAEHPEIRRRQAIKVLHPELIRDPQSQLRFLDEARIASAIRHPNIVEIFDVGTLAPEGTAYIAMEYLAGEDLAARLARRSRLDVAEAIDLAGQAAAALDAAHARDVVHRDLKPANLFLVPDDARPGRDRIKVLDFGVAKLRGPLVPRAAHTGAGFLLGTPSYMSPEQCRGATEVDPRSDIYSLGLILYEMLCGAPPFVSDTVAEVMTMHTRQPPVPPRQRDPAIPEPLERIVLCALAKDPAQRFASAAELAAALAALPVSHPGAPPAPGPRVGRQVATRVVPGSVVLAPPHMAGSRKAGAARWVLAGGAALLVLGAAALALSLRTPPPRPDPAVRSDAAVGADAQVASDAAAAPDAKVSPPIAAGRPVRRDAGAVLPVHPDAPPRPPDAGVTADARAAAPPELPAAGTRTALMACSQSCRELAGCGLSVSPGCAESCASNRQVAACALDARDGCSGAAACAVAALCGGGAPAGSASCNATFECEQRCGADAACACRCAGMLAPQHALVWLRTRICALSCHHDAACFQTRCSRHLLACQTE